MSSEDMGDVGESFVVSSARLVSSAAGEAAASAEMAVCQHLDQMNEIEDGRLIRRWCRDCGLDVSDAGLFHERVGSLPMGSSCEPGERPAGGSDYSSGVFTASGSFDSALTDDQMSALTGSLSGSRFRGVRWRGGGDWRSALMLGLLWVFIGVSAGVLLGVIL